MELTQTVIIIVIVVIAIVAIVALIISSVTYNSVKNSLVGLSKEEIYRHIVDSMKKDPDVVTFLSNPQGSEQET